MIVVVVVFDRYYFQIIQFLNIFEQLHSALIEKERVGFKKLPTFSGTLK